MQEAKDRHIGACYKQSYLAYHIAACESFKELLDLLEKNEKLGNQPLTSFSRSEPKEFTYAVICMTIRQVRNGGQIQWIARAEGLRAKVAELVLSNNYGDVIPEDIRTDYLKTPENGGTN